MTCVGDTVMRFRTFTHLISIRLTIRPPLSGSEQEAATTVICYSDPGFATTVRNASFMVIDVALSGGHRKYARRRRAGLHAAMNLIKPDRFCGLMLSRPNSPGYSGLVGLAQRPGPRRGHSLTTGCHERSFKTRFVYRDDVVGPTVGLGAPQAN